MQQASTKFEHDIQSIASTVSVTSIFPVSQSRLEDPRTTLAPPVTRRAAKEAAHAPEDLLRIVRRNRGNRAFMLYTEDRLILVIDRGDTTHLFSGEIAVFPDVSPIDAWIRDSNFMHDYGLSRADFRSPHWQTVYRLSV